MRQGRSCASGGHIFSLLREKIWKKRALGMRGAVCLSMTVNTKVEHCGHHTVIFLPYRTTAPPVWDNAPNDSRCRGMTWANRLRYEWQRITYSPEEQVLPPGGCRHPPLQMIKGSSTMRPGEKSKRGGAHAPFLVALRGLPRGKFEIPLGRPFLFPLKACFFPAQGKTKGLKRSLGLTIHIKTGMLKYMLCCAALPFGDCGK